MSRVPNVRVVRTRQEWRWLVLLLLALACTVGWMRWQAHRQVMETEAQRLHDQVAAMSANLAHQVQGAYQALQGVRDDLVHWPPEDRPAVGSARLRALTNAIPGVRTMILFDANGQVVASNRPELLGQNFSHRSYLEPLLAQPDPSLLYLSPPYRTLLGAYAINLAVVMTAAEGQFDGAVTATLDPSYFEVLLRTSRYAGDVRAAVAHGQGGVLVTDPPTQDVEDLSLAMPDSPFERHLAGGQASSLQRGTYLAEGQQRLVAIHTLAAPVLPLDQPLVLMLSRSQNAMLASWRRDSAVAAALTLLLAAVASVALRVLQQRQQAFESLTGAREAQTRIEAERLRLVLRGGDLALWDLDVPTGRATVNERWATMLGHAPGEVDGSTASWLSLLHPEDRDAVQALQEAHLSGRSDSYEAVYRLQHRQGHWLWVLDRGLVVERDPAGQALRMVGTHLDITARVQSEEALRRNEQSLSVTLQSIGDAVIATDAQGCITRINDAARRLTGWEGDSALGQPLGQVFRIFSAETREPGLDPVARVLATGTVVGLANGTLLVARDGREHQIADSAAPIRTEDGSVLGVVLVFSDVTEQYRMLQALRHSEQKSRGLLASLHSGVVVHAGDTRVLEANPAACRVLGLSLEQLRGKAAIDPYWCFLEEDGSPMAPARYPVNQVLAGQDTLQDLVVGLRRPDLPRPVWALCAAFALRAEDGALQEVVVTFYDITQRKQAEEALQRSSARLRLAGRLARLGSWSLDLASGRVELSADAATFMGAARAQAPVFLADIMALVRPAYRASLDSALHCAEAFDIEVEAVMPKGRLLVLRLMGEPVCDEQGQRIATQGAVQDVTEWRREQQELRLLQTAVAQIDDAVMITAAGPAGETGPPVVFVNAAFERLSGWQASAALGRPPGLLLAPDTETAGSQGLNDALARHQSLRTELLTHRRDGSLYWMEVQLAPLSDVQGRVTHMVAVLRDITERKQAEAQRTALERQLRESQKMESIGTLAGGIAHDFNNILPAILGHVALAQQDLPAAHPVRANLEQIQRAGLRARALVQQILTFSRRQPQTLVAQPLQPVLQETLALLRVTLPASVRLETSICLDDTPVAADATQLQQVLMNLCTNAWHALPQGRGLVEVGLEAVDADEAERLGDGSPRTGRWMHLWVRDNGCGMDAFTRERLFDPFFTTKPVGQGTGLGLPVVHGIVRGHGGCIGVQSTPGAGSCFHVLLPLIETAAALAPQPEASAASVAERALAAAAPAGPVAGAHIWYADDEPVMTLMVQSLLEREGYRVSTFDSAAQVLARARQGLAPPALVITDYNMPELSGLELAQQLARLWPGVPVLLTTGYVDEGLPAEAFRHGVRALLRKERTLEDLPAMVRELLADHGSGESGTPADQT